MECYALRLGSCNCAHLNSAQLNILASSFEHKFIIVSFTTNNNSIMSQADIDAFVHSAHYGTLTPQDMTAAVARGIPVNGRNSKWGITVLHYAVRFKRRDLVAALLTTGADPNVKDKLGATSVWWSAVDSTADILQLLIDGGGSVNEPCDLDRTPLIALARNNCHDAPARLQVLLACPELDLHAGYDGMTAEDWAVRRGHAELAAAIAEERLKRVRWSAVRCAWVAATAHN
jgi:ankyrin repeat protein